ncbi:MAG: MotE family protein [Chitinophagales bacterium]
MRNVLKIIGAIIALAFITAGSIYLGFIKPPGFLRNIPFVGKYATKNQQPVKSEFSRETMLENRLKTTEKDLDYCQNRIAELENKNEQLQSELKTAREEVNSSKEEIDKNNARDIEYGKLSQYYSNMKATQAAAIMSQMDDETAIGILENMKPDAAGSVLGRMEPGRAAALTKQMLQ